MYTTFHLSSAEDVTADILETIRATFKSKPITITVEEELDTTAYLMASPANKAMLDKSIEQHRNGDTIRIKHGEL